MDLLKVLNIVEIIVSIALVISILLQQQGSGLGTMFGGAGGESYRSKRGFEKLLYNLTVILIVVFVVVALAIAVVSVRS
jgi:preprotein translocase subunit SecG